MIVFQASHQTEFAIYGFTTRSVCQQEGGIIGKEKKSQQKGHSHSAKQRPPGCDVYGGAPGQAHRVDERQSLRLNVAKPRRGNLAGQKERARGYLAQSGRAVFTFSANHCRAFE